MEHIVGDGVEARFTQFPDLRSNFLDTNGTFDEADIAFSSLASIDNATEILTCAWAYLLCCYTGVDRPIFRVRNRALHYDLNTKRGWEVTVADIDQGRDSRTGVVSNEVKRTTVRCMSLEADSRRPKILPGSLYTSDMIDNKKYICFTAPASSRAVILVRSADS